MKKIKLVRGKGLRRLSTKREELKKFFKICKQVIKEAEKIKRMPLFWFLN